MSRARLAALAAIVLMGQTGCAALAVKTAHDAMHTAPPDPIKIWCLQERDIPDLACPAWPAPDDVSLEAGREPRHLRDERFVVGREAHRLCAAAAEVYRAALMRCARPAGQD